MEKVEVNKKLFDILNEFGTLSICKSRARDFIFTEERFLILNELTFEESMDIHYKGYELQKTPEEKFLEVYNTVNLCNFDKGEDISIKCALKNLAINIKGVNS